MSQLLYGHGVLQVDWEGPLSLDGEGAEAEVNMQTSPLCGIDD